MVKRHFTAVLGLSLLLAACGTTVENLHTLSTQNIKNPGGKAGEVTGRYLVGFKPGKGVDRKAIARAGGQLGKSFDRIDAAAVTLTPAAAKRLAQDPDVEYVEPVQFRYAAGSPLAVTDQDAGVAGTTLGKPGGTLGGKNYNWQPDGEMTYGNVGLNVPVLHPQQQGAEVAVCVADTGIDGDHPELAGMLQDFKNFMKEADRPEVEDPNNNDTQGHGTHVGGTIAAQYGNAAGGLLSDMKWSGGVVGVAPQVNLYAARVLGSDGYGTTEAVIGGVLWCAEKLASGEEQRMIINLSLGSGKPHGAAQQQESKTERRAMQAAYDMGALIVAAAGNDASKEPHYPSDHPSVVKVGAVDHNGDLAAFSNYNAKQELVAPGVDVLSTVPVGLGREAKAEADGTPFTQTYAASGSSVGSAEAAVMVAEAPAGTNHFCDVRDSAGQIVQETVNPNLQGKIALISRGSCTFGEKVDNAVASGAAAVIIYNNRDGVVVADLGGAKSIPVITVLQAEGQQLRDAVESSSNPILASISVKATDYDYYSGTSMATPHVAGAAALVWSAKPNLTNAQLRELLVKTAIDLGANERDNFFGHGLVNPQGAISQP